MNQKRNILKTSRHISAPEDQSGMALEGILAGFDALGALKKERREELAKDARKLGGQPGSSVRG